MHPLAKLDHKFIWHPFTQMADWLKTEPIIIAEGAGAVLKDVRGKEYIDANSSIWTNLHGHCHPALNAAINRQLKKISHSSALGLANEPASLLAEKLVQATQPPAKERLAKHRLDKVFFSDDGSTAMEVALKLAYEYTRRSGRSAKPRFISLDNAYHGDTVGAVSAGHIDLFHKAYSGLLFRTDKAKTPYCYRCPHNRARPQRADARDYRQCSTECLTDLSRRFEWRARGGATYSAFIFEPLMQGAAGMIAQPEGWLKQATDIARSHGALLIADEVMTGFGRTGAGTRRSTSNQAPLFACQREGVTPDFLAVAKGLTGGYLPMAATLTTLPVFNAFLGDYSEFKTFFHGHSFTGNQLGSAAALASLDLLGSPRTVAVRGRIETEMQAHLETLWALPEVGDIRRVGLVAGIELVQEWRSRNPFPLEAKAGIRVCEEMAKQGVLTRPVGNVIVIMPPYCTTSSQLDKVFGAFRRSLKVLR